MTLTESKRRLSAAIAASEAAGWTDACVRMLPDGTVEIKRGAHFTATPANDADAADSEIAAHRVKRALKRQNAETH